MYDSVRGPSYDPAIPSRTALAFIIMNEQQQQQQQQQQEHFIDTEDENDEDQIKLSSLPHTAAAAAAAAADGRRPEDCLQSLPHFGRRERLYTPRQRPIKPKFLHSPNQVFKELKSIIELVIRLQWKRKNKLVYFADLLFLQFFPLGKTLDG